MEGWKLKIFERLAKIELLVSDIYMRLSEVIPDDKEFWWRLAMEERGHASLIRTGYETFEAMNLFPDELTSISLEELDRSVEEKESLLKRLSSSPSPISREEALRAALAIEEQDIEMKFQSLMEKVSESKAMRLFQTLNKDTHDHAKRIKARLSEALPS